MSNLPPIPEIGGDVDILLDIYTHASLRPLSYTPTNTEYGDTDRLAELGASALDLSVTNYFYLLRPFLSGTEMQVCVYASLLSSCLSFVHDSYVGVDSGLDVFF
jgi:hypothetical protein